MLLQWKAVRKVVRWAVRKTKNHNLDKKNILIQWKFSVKLYSFEEALQLFREKSAIRKYLAMANPSSLRFHDPSNHPLGVLEGWFFPEFCHFLSTSQRCKMTSGSPLHDRELICSQVMGSWCSLVAQTTTMCICPLPPESATWSLQIYSVRAFTWWYVIITHLFCLGKIEIVSGYTNCIS